MRRFYCNFTYFLIKCSWVNFMLINFNMEKLDRLLYDFYFLTGITIGIFDSDYNQLCLQPREMQNFCRMIKSSPEGKRRCHLSDKAVCLECAKTEKAVTHYCHAGLLDTAVPIKFKDEVLGYMMFGQVAETNKKSADAALKELSVELGLDYSSLITAYNSLKNFDKEKIDSAANILKTATRYLWLSDYIELGYDTLSSQIDDYIKAHISENVSVKDICAYFGISKNRLYDISHKWFGMPIGNYISAIRISEAKHLLTTTDLPVNQIGAMVGIKDYNYFTKFFKSKTGIPPLKFRKSN